MQDVFVLKAAHDMDDGVHLADIGQKLVAQALALRRALDQARDIDEFDGRRRVFLRVVHLGEPVEAFVGHGDDADVGFDGAEGVIGRFRARVRDRVEQGALADVRQTHDPHFHGV